MAKKHGARQQKKVARQKAKRQAKKTVLARRTSSDPTVRLERADTWPILETLISSTIHEDGIGYVVIAREQPDTGIVFAYFLVDIYCLGVKDCFWHADTRARYREMIDDMQTDQKLKRCKPECAAKLVSEAVAFADSFGFAPHRDYRHVARLLEGIDPAACTTEFEFGRDGKPFYINGPHETPAQMRVICEKVIEAGGHYMIGGPADAGPVLLERDDGLEYDEFEDDDLDEEEFDDEGPDEPDEPRSRSPIWRWPGRK